MFNLLIIFSYFNVAGSFGSPPFSLVSEPIEENRTLQNGYDVLQTIVGY